MSHTIMLARGEKIGLVAYSAPRNEEATAHHFSLSLFFFSSKPWMEAPPPAPTGAGGLSSSGGATPMRQCGPTAECAVAAMASSHGWMRQYGPTIGCAAAMASSRSSASTTPLPFLSMCGGDGRTLPWRWILHGAAAAPVLYGERHSSLLRHVCCSMDCTRARLPWRSSAVPVRGSLGELAASRWRRQGDTTRGSVCGA
jgi:hypothetical protein